VITCPGEAEVVEVALPEPQPGEVRLRLSGTGVCASNLPLWQGTPCAGCMAERPTAS
jgi:D-arabinose 1-dehydrogenase-like Zn-dependent alcohol dehydrogenase